MRDFEDGPAPVSNRRRFFIPITRSGLILSGRARALAAIAKSHAIRTGCEARTTAWNAARA